MYIRFESLLHFVKNIKCRDRLSIKRSDLIRAFYFLRVILEPSFRYKSGFQSLKKINMNTDFATALVTLISSVLLVILVGLHRIDWMIKMINQNCSTFLCFFEILSIWHLLYFLANLTSVKEFIL